MSLTFSSSYIALWALVIFQGLLVLALLQRLEKLRQLATTRALSEDRLLEGGRAPEFAGLDRHSGQQFGVRSLAEQGGMILFLSSECPTCKALVDKLARVAHDNLPSIIVVCQGREQACARLAKRLGTRIRLVLDGAAETAARYRVSDFPTAVAVDPRRKIRGYGHPKDVGEIRDLWSRSLTEFSSDHGTEKRSSALMTA